jgi:4'-phosphopantetheinyl transferase
MAATAPGWLTRSLADLPPGDGWLSPREREALAGLTVEKRRRDWLLGRLAAKAAVGSWLGAEPKDVEVLAAPDGAPEARLAEEAAGIALSISHRAGRALAAVANAPAALGCDLEALEPRSGAFVREWLAPSERELLEGLPEERRALWANLAWTAKEAAAKARREGLRLDVRSAAVAVERVAEPGPRWRPLEVRWPEGGPRLHGWWREEPAWVMAVVAEPAPERPRELDAQVGSATSAPPGSPASGVTRIAPSPEA